MPQEEEPSQLQGQKRTENLWVEATVRVSIVRMEISGRMS